MTMTINSGVSPYCTPALFVVIYDWRTFAQLASDTDVPVSSSANLQVSPVLATMLGVAAGEIEMACTARARYDPTDLAALVTPTITNGGYILVQMNAALAAGKMYDRRFEAAPADIAKQVDDARMKLAALEEGVEIFSFADTQQAGIITDYKETANDVYARNLPSTYARRCLGRRDNTIPYGRRGSGSGF